MTVIPPGPPGPPYAMAPGGPVGYPWTPPPPQRRTSLVVALAAAMILGTAALVVNLVNMARSTPPSAASTTTTSAAAATAPAADATDADRSLCTAIAPLMTENDKSNNDYTDLGAAGTPARDAATPQFITDTKNWITRVQPILDQHPDANAYFQRSLQRYIDDRDLLVLDLGPGPLTSSWSSIWRDSLGAYSGVYHLCKKLGVTW